MKKWEYKTIGIMHDDMFDKVLHKTLDEKLTDLGNEGWELVNTFQEFKNGGPSLSAGFYVTFVFKRPKED